MPASTNPCSPRSVQVLDTLECSSREPEAREHGDGVAPLPTGMVTLLFSDIEGSTRLLEHLGDEFAELLGAHRRIVRQAVRDHDGREVNIAGDGFFVAFQRADHAVRAAVEVQRRHVLASWPDGVAVQVRMGLHTGRPLVSGDDYIGIDVHRAARICAIADGGQVIVSDATKRALAGWPIAGVGMCDLGEYWLRGLSRPLRLHRVVADRLATRLQDGTHPSPSTRSASARFATWDGPAPGARAPAIAGVEFETIACLSGNGRLSLDTSASAL